MPASPGTMAIAGSSDEVVARRRRRDHASRRRGAGAVARTAVVRPREHRGRRRLREVPRVGRQGRRAAVPRLPQGPRRRARRGPRPARPAVPHPAVRGVPRRAHRAQHQADPVAGRRDGAARSRADRLGARRRPRPGRVPEVPHPDLAAAQAAVRRHPDRVRRVPQGPARRPVHRRVPDAATAPRAGRRSIAAGSITGSRGSR